MEKTIDAAVIGSNGFVGSNMSIALRKNKKSVMEIERDSEIDVIKQHSFGCVYFCAGNSLTFLSKDEPLKCLQQNVADLYPYLVKLKYNKFIYVSSILVYPRSNSQLKEDVLIDISKLGLYGAHKYMGERYVREFANKWLIVRPTSFFGNGLKKNLLYDLRNNMPHVYLKKDSWMDYTPIDWFCERLTELAEMKENEIINMGSGHPIPVDRIVSLKNIAYKFHEERWQDDRNVDLSKMSNCGINMLRPDALERMIKDFVTTDV